MLNLLKSLKKSRKGAALVEYGLVIAGVALVGAASVSIFGHKTAGLVATTAAVIPGVNEEDNGPIVTGRLIETTPGGQLDFSRMQDNEDRLESIGGGLSSLVVEPGREHRAKKARRRTRSE